MKTGYIIVLIFMLEEAAGFRSATVAPPTNHDHDSRPVGTEYNHGATNYDGSTWEDVSKIMELDGNLRDG